ncbi:MAG: DUF4919 domain-containing protein [Prevotellaceae bacterium]|jgi:hypothetical protein|nr:DUF4919 domain-containing protein [Prevotellaceae bacterium]
MKSIKFLCVLFIFLPLKIYAQNENIGETQNNFILEIKQVVTDTNSLFYYPLLLEKVLNNADEITVMDCFYLYYGQIFQQNYVALSFIANPERVAFDRAAMNGNCKKTIQLGKIILARNPVDLTVLLHTSVCIDKQKKYIDNDYFPQRFKNLLSAIFLTGDGKTKETAIKIVNIEDDYVLKGVLGFLGGTESLDFSIKNHAYSVWTKNGVNLYFEDIVNIENIKLPKIEN